MSRRILKPFAKSPDCPQLRFPFCRNPIGNIYLNLSTSSPLFPRQLSRFHISLHLKCVSVIDLSQTGNISRLWNDLRIDVPPVSGMVSDRVVDLRPWQWRTLSEDSGSCPWGGTRQACVQHVFFYDGAGTHTPQFPLTVTVSSSGFGGTNWVTSRGMG